MGIGINIAVDSTQQLNQRPAQSFCLQTFKPDLDFKVW